MGASGIGFIEFSKIKIVNNDVPSMPPDPKHVCGIIILINIYNTCNI